MAERVKSHWVNGPGGQRLMLDDAGAFLLPGISLVLQGSTLVIASQQPLFLLSSAVLGGGFLQGRYIINHHVSKDYDGEDPAGDLLRVAKDLGLNGPVVGLMTAVDVARAVIMRESTDRKESERDGASEATLSTWASHRTASTKKEGQEAQRPCVAEDPLTVVTVVTAGVGNPGRAGAPLTCAGHRLPGETVSREIVTASDGNVPASTIAPSVPDLSSPAAEESNPRGLTRPETKPKSSGPFRPGTINIILLVDGTLTPAAMVNAVLTATEAKTRALFELGVRCPDGGPATGTTSDAIVVAATGRGQPHQFAGTATVVGQMIGRAVYAAVYQGVEEYWERVKKRGRSG